MALVNVVNIEVQDNPASFNTPFSFEVTFECVSKLDDDLDWRVVYVGSAEDASHDQELESVLVGPVPVGVNKFLLTTAPPDPAKIPAADLLGVTVVLITCSYKSREFIRVGYYVNNELVEEDVDTSGESAIDTSKIRRNIMAENPRVTRFSIEWT